MERDEEKGPRSTFHALDIHIDLTHKRQTRTCPTVQVEWEAQEWPLTPRLQRDNSEAATTTEPTTAHTNDPIPPEANDPVLAQSHPCDDDDPNSAMNCASLRCCTSLVLLHAASTAALQAWLALPWS